MNGIDREAVTPLDWVVIGLFTGLGVLVVASTETPFGVRLLASILVGGVIWLGGAWAFGRYRSRTG